MKFATPNVDEARIALVRNRNKFCISTRGGFYPFHPRHPRARNTLHPPPGMASDLRLCCRCCLLSHR